MTLRAGVAKLAGAALAGSLLIVAAPAAAGPCNSTHNGQVNQYLENIPGPCGDNPLGGNGSGEGTSIGSGSSATGLPGSTINQLESMGPAGSQAASFAEATNPGGGAGAGGNGSASAGSGSKDGTASDGGGGSLLSALEDAVTGASAGGAGEGLGTWLPILLGAVLLVGVATLALRRGRTG